MDVPLITPMIFVFKGDADLQLIASARETVERGSSVRNPDRDCFAGKVVPHHELAGCYSVVMQVLPSSTDHPQGNNNRSERRDDRQDRRNDRQDLGQVEVEFEVAGDAHFWVTRTRCENVYSLSCR